MRATFTTRSSGCVDVRYLRPLESPTCEAQALTLTVFSIGIEMETFEKIAEILEVPPYVFYDGNFDVRLFRDYVVKGHHNPTSFFGPIYNGGDAPFSAKDSEADSKAAKEMEETQKKNEELIKAKDETISVLQKQVDDLLADKSDMRSELQALKAENAELRTRLNGK